MVHLHQQPACGPPAYLQRVNSSPVEVQREADEVAVFCHNLWNGKGTSKSHVCENNRVRISSITACNGCRRRAQTLHIHLPLVGNQQTPCIPSVGSSISLLRSPLTRSSLANSLQSSLRCIIILVPVLTPEASAISNIPELGLETEAKSVCASRTAMMRHENTCMLSV